MSGAFESTSASTISGLKHLGPVLRGCAFTWPIPPAMRRKLRRCPAPQVGFVRPTRHGWTKQEHNGSTQKLMRHAHISTTMDQYGNASTVAKRKANRPILHRLLRRNESAGLDSITKGNYEAVPPPVDIEEAFTRSKWTGAEGQNCAHELIGNRNLLFCGFPVTTYCTTETTPPDWTIDPPYMEDLCASRDGLGGCLPPVKFGWDAKTICVRWKSLRGAGKPWTCAGIPFGISILGDLNDPNTQPADCTHNP